MKNKILSILLTFVLMFTLTASSVFAATEAELQQQKNEEQKKLNDAKSHLTEVQGEKSEAKKAAETASAAVSDIEGQISLLQAQIDDLNADITEKQEEIEVKEKQLKERMKQLKKRLTAMYIQGDISYLDFLLGSSNYIDMLANYDAVQQITAADGKMIDSIKTEKELKLKKINQQKNQREQS